MEHVKVNPEAVMHASMHIGDAMIMCSDGMSGDGKTNFQGFSLALNVANEAEADKAFEALAKDGEIQMPIGKTFFSPRFGCVADKFGVSWMVIVPQEMRGLERDGFRSRPLNGARHSGGAQAPSMSKA
jgi:uncharacterized glyoxalase superfamily protein PhnB